MKNLIKYLSFLLIIMTAMISLPSCKDSLADHRVECKDEILDLDESLLVAEYLEKRGDPVNCKLSCNVEAKDVYKNLDNNYYVIDIRKKGDFDAGHIKGSINLPIRKLYYHFMEKIEPFKYDKIVLCCYSGQSATYATSLLRLLGFYNVYAMEWGMSSWNSKLSAGWMGKKTPSLNLDLDPIAGTVLEQKFGMPILRTGKVWREQIIHTRVQELLMRQYKPISAKADEVITKKNTFIIAYGDENFENGNHLPGANFFEIKESLKRSEKLQNIPLRQEVIVYSKNGFESAYAVAYLRLLGYNAKTISYGVNTFKKQTSNFSQKDIHEYPLEVATNGQVIVAEEAAGGC